MSSYCIDGCMITSAVILPATSIFNVKYDRNKRANSLIWWWVISSRNFIFSNTGHQIPFIKYSRMCLKTKDLSNHSIPTNNLINFFDWFTSRKYSSFNSCFHDKLPSSFTWKSAMTFKTASTYLDRCWLNPVNFKIRPVSVEEKLIEICEALPG